MKFTKEDAFEKLKGILTNDGKKPLRMSEKSINGQLETLMPLIATEEMEIDDFVGKVKASFEVMNSNAEKDNSDFVNDWKKNHPDTEPNPTNPTTPKKDDTHNDLLERLEKMELELANAKKEESLKFKRNELRSAMKKKGIDNDEWSNMMLDEIQITEELDVDTKADSLLKIYNKQQANIISSQTPLSPSGGNDTNKDIFADVKETRKEENKAKEKIV